MAPELALGGLQRWLQAVIEAPGPVARALRSREAARLVRPGRTRDVVLPSASLSAAERVGVYHDMYMPRMLEALESDYPGLAHFLGEAAWQRLVRGYVSAHPSRSHSLNELGRRLPEFVRRARVPRPRSAATSRGSSGRWPRCSTRPRRSRSASGSFRRSRLPSGSVPGSYPWRRCG